MSAVIVTIADGVVSALNGGSFSQGFTASRGWRPRVKLEDLANVSVTVAPRSSRTNGMLTRTTDRVDHVIDVTVMRRTDETDTDLDPWVLLAEEIANALRRLVIADAYKCVEVQVDPVCAVEELDAARLFTSVISATFLSVQVAT